MSVKNKKKYAVYLDEENAEYVKSFLELTRNKGGLSGVVDGYLKTMAFTLKASGYKKGQKKMTPAQLIRFGINALKQDPA